MSSGLVRSVRTNELQRKKLEKYLTNSKVRLVRTNELQQGAKNCNSQDWHRCAPCAPMNYNSQRLGFGSRSPGYAPCVPTNYNDYVIYNADSEQGALRAHQRITTVINLPSPTCSERCASCAPMNCNTVYVAGTAGRTGALRAHQRITTGMLRHVAGQMTRCAPCAPTNYNGCTRTMMIQLAWCASYAPMNCNQCIPNVSQCCSGALHAHQ